MKIPDTKAGSTLAANSCSIKRFLTPPRKTRLAAWCAKHVFCHGRHIKLVWYTWRSPRLAARGSTPAASVRSTCGKTWRQKPLDAAWVGGECAACFNGILGIVGNNWEKLWPVWSMFQWAGITLDELRISLIPKALNCEDLQFWTLTYELWPSKGEMENLHYLILSRLLLGEVLIFLDFWIQVLLNHQKNVEIVIWGPLL
jgi:hypothetical protein